MRVELRLSAETEELLRKEKQAILNAEGINITYGYLVNKKIKIIYPIYNWIDWKKVKDYEFHSLNDDKVLSDTNKPTTLNLENSVIKNIEEIQIHFKEVFKAARIHRAFAVRMIIKACKLIEIKDINIFIPDTAFKIDIEETK